jgi:hypothetical protein
MTVAFKAYAFEQMLRDEGIGEKEARAIAKATEAHVVEGMLTRDSLDQSLKSETASLKAEIAAMKFELLRWIVGVAAASTLAIVLALLRTAR